MQHRFFAGWLLSLCSSVSLAQVPAADLMKPPADARHFIIESTGGKHGDSWSWVAANGTRMGRESMNLRGQIWEIDYTGTPGADEMPPNPSASPAPPRSGAARSMQALAPIPGPPSTTRKADRSTQTLGSSSACLPAPTRRWICCPAVGRMPLN